MILPRGFLTQIPSFCFWPNSDDTRSIYPGGGKVLLFISVACCGEVLPSSALLLFLPHRFLDLKLKNMAVELHNDYLYCNEKM